MKVTMFLSQRWYELCSDTILIKTSTLCYWNLVSAIQSQLETLKIALNNIGFHLHNLLALGTDYACVMTGINSGAFARLKAEVPNLWLMRCVCHSLQLAVSEAARDTMPRHLQFTIKETIGFHFLLCVKQDTKCCMKLSMLGYHP